MMKKTISLFLAFMMIFTMTMSPSVLGVDKDHATHKKQDVMELLLDDDDETGYSSEFLKREVTAIGTEFVKIVNCFLGYRKTDNISYKDLIIDKADTVVEAKEDTTNNKVIKILTIGNSFSQDASQYIFDIAKSAGINVVVGNIYFAGCSLKTHWTNATSNNATYTYNKWTSSDMIKSENQTMKDCILDEKWDFIVFQQASGDSGLYNTFQPYLNNLVKYVKGLSTNPNVKLALNMTWAYAADSTHPEFKNYSNDQKIMYNSIINSYKKAITETGIDIVIPCGTAIQNARTNANLCGVGDELTLDGYHLNEGIGRYIAGLTYFETLVVKYGNIKKDLFTDVSFFPDRYERNAQLAYMSKIAVKNAVMDSFKITEIEN